MAGNADGRQDTLIVLAWMVPLVFNTVVWQGKSYRYVVKTQIWYSQDHQIEHFLFSDPNPSTW